MHVMGFSSFPPISSHFGTLNYPAAQNQHHPVSDLSRKSANTGPPALPGVLSHIHSKTACRGASACRWHASYEPTEEAAETKSFCPCHKTGENTGFSPVFFLHVLHGFVVHFGSDTGFSHLV